VSPRKTAAAAPTKLGIKLDGPNVTVGHVQQAITAFVSMLREVSAEIAGKDRDQIQWVVSKAKAGSFELQSTPRIMHERVLPTLPATISRTVATGIDAIQKGATRPAYFNDRAMTSARTLASLVEHGVSSVQIVADSKRIRVTHETIQHVNEVIGPQYESYGTVEGTLQALTVHGKRQFFIYEPLTDNEVACRFGENIPLSDVLKGFTKRVSATGLIRSRKSGQRLSIEVQEFFVFPGDSDLPRADDVRGIMKANERAR
jgi:hypothetical protein